ncbi:uncharacterized protein V1518DRAFT_86882 [Limtongia smithiae]|uniref:uncharacterized protein n=1 Tax=Limtongia smithiae TaxID=1125753 RepID=UPI0034CF8087
MLCIMRSYGVQRLRPVLSPTQRSLRKFYSTSSSPPAENAPAAPASATNYGASGLPPELDYELDKSVLLTDPETWIPDRLKRVKPLRPESKLSEWSRRFQNNPYVLALCGPVRMCAAYSSRLPLPMLVRLSIFEVPEHLRETVVMATHNPSGAKSGDKHGKPIKTGLHIILPLEPGQKDSHSGITAYHILRRNHVTLTEQKGASNLYKAKFAANFALPASQVVWKADMDLLIERRLRARLAAAVQTVRVGVHATLERAEARGIPCAVLSWKSKMNPSTRTLMDSEMIFNVRYSVPIMKYYVNELCGHETAEVLREALFAQVRADEKGDVVPDEVVVNAANSTKKFLMQLWLLRLYIGDRRDIVY